MDKRSLIIGFILIPILVLAQNIDVYIVDNSDYKLIETKSVDQKDAGFDYSTIILVYDRYRDEIIGGCGSYKKGRPTTAKFREVINEVNNSDSIPMFYCYEKNPILAKYNVLGLSWGMDKKQSLSQLRSLGLVNISNNERESVVIIDDIYWNYIKYDAIRLGYYISNKQNEFLVTVGLIRMFDTAEEAKNFREKVKHSLVYDFGKESVKEKIEENGFKSYTVMHDIGHVKGSVRMQKIQLVIDKGHDGYAVIVNYNGWDEILDYMQSENNW